jgi:hypothetical protein
MTSLALPSPTFAPSSYDPWLRHFLQNRGGLHTLPWTEPQRLTPAERRLVTRSMQQFQLGEFARGRGFMRRASAHPVLGSDPEWLPALQLFIAEEQEHSNILGRYLDREGIPRLKAHWLDGIFRRLRKLAGLELCAAVLVTAETLAIPFYQALRDATHSPLLRVICVRILCDEAAHLKFQALTLGLIRRTLGKRARAIRSLGHAVLFRGTALLLWQQHCRVFRAAHWDFRRFWNEARREFRLLERQIGQAASEGAHFASYDRQILG